MDTYFHCSSLVKVFALHKQLSQSFILFFSSYLNNFKGSICMLSTRISFKYSIKPVYRGGGGQDSQPQVTNTK